MELETNFNFGYSIYIHDEIIQLFNEQSNYKIYFEKEFINPIIWEEVENESISHLYYLLKTYSYILLKNEKVSHLTIAYSELHSVDSAIQRLK